MLEKIMTALPSNMIMSRVIPHGVEAVMFSLAHTIMNLNMFQLRTMMGVIINDHFVHVTKENFAHFYILEVIGIIGTCIPFFYMHKLIPTQKEVEELEDKNQKKFKNIGSL